MACEYKEEIISFNGKEVKFSCDQFPAEKAIVLKFKIIKVFGGALADLTGLVNAEDSKESITKLFEVIGNIFVKNKPEEVLALIKETITGARIDNNILQSSQFNEKFSGDDMMLAYRLFFFIIKSNYSNFIQTAQELKAV